MINGKRRPLSQPMEPSRHGLRGVFVILLAFVLTMTAVQGLSELRERPNQSQRIAAIIVSWGVSPEGFRVPVEQDEIDRRVALLRSADGEQRVRAAHWLAAHGVREAGAAIVASMHDPATLRPCQLAHALGQLGDGQWTSELVWAAKQPWNRDLQVCATFGLQELASERAIDALIELAESGSARTSAVEALGAIGDARALPMLEQLVKSTSERHVLNSAVRAIDRIRLLSMPDPVPVLLGQLEEGVRDGQFDAWALRCLARFGDERAVPHLKAALQTSSLTGSERESVAACLLVCGDKGRLALAHCSMDDTTTAGAVARSALDVIPQFHSPSMQQTALSLRAVE